MRPYGSLFLAPSKDVVAGNATGWRKKVGKMRCGGVNWRKWCWLVDRDTGHSNPEHMNINSKGSGAEKFDFSRFDRID